MTYRRGFKSEADGYARSIREELGLAPHAPLCAWKLANYLGYVVYPLSDYAKLEPAAYAYLTSERGKREFSAITLFGETQAFIIHNDAHHQHRQSANISHEVAHGLLIHKPAPLAAADGNRNFDAEQEREANWLGPALLVSKEAALHIVETRMERAAARTLYHVSEELLEMRLRMSGALIRARRRVA